MPEEDVNERKLSPLVKLAILGALLIIGAVIAWFVDIPSADEIRARVAAAGLVGVLVFVLAYAGLSLTPTPASVLSIAAGVLFGFAGGIAAVFAAAMLSASLAYILGRHLGADALSRYGGPKTATAVLFLRRRGFASVLIVRLVPLFPFWLVNYAGGISGIRFRHYFLGTALGIIPGVMSYVALGAFGTQPLSWPFAAAIAAFIVLTVGGGYAARRMQNKRPELSSRQEPDRV
ncbi:TVP38/TMEM64 family protein [Hoyosella rhizosphaerae]|uniref:TVP38/TMEM64 family membrane protein n=1 Tax=Hoyosella rhizosphaerae TaxID=1755582 RepID=A0A916U9C0_9ACTN|nr:VTT domain-containing protein [Hoyosella rhizosphaerae]MBN4927647.1 TVP38/TMEM64 family protein [Hoyosella rhizosphaerae]GGC62785.1 hypothetical protein GCM10011410_14040 [Hoyosella rhizosphaerae]